MIKFRKARDKRYLLTIGKQSWHLSIEESVSLFYDIYKRIITDKTMR
jgi:hypothetical protein